MHGSQPVEPSSVWKVPTPQSSQVSRSFSSVYVPRAQSLGSAEPTAHEVPRGQTMQSDLPVMTREVFMCVPPGHGSGAAEPSAQ